ncbi:MAG: hypothetical protein ABIQ30_02765 [Devosia sp.]
MALFVKRFDRNDERLAEIESEVRFFLGELDDIIGKLNDTHAIETRRAA